MWVSSLNHSYDILGARMLWKRKEARILKNFIDQLLYADLAQSCLPGEQGEKDRQWQIAQFPSVPKNKLSQKVSDKTEQSIDMLLDGPLKSKLKMDARNL